MLLPRRILCPWLVALAISFSLAFGAEGGDWPCWRGPGGLGVSTETHLPTQWSKSNHVAWSSGIPGRGASSPIIIGDRVYLTTQTDDTGLHVLALEVKTGRVLWDRMVGQGKLPANKLHNMATPTPVSDGRNIWAMFGTGDLVCLDRAGQVVWQRNLVKEFGAYKTNHGYGSSPMLQEGRLFVVCMHQGPSYVLALEAKSGKTAWKQDRNMESKDEAQDSYSSPIFLRGEARTQMILAGAESVNSYDPATGDQLWMAGGLKVNHPYGRTISGPTAAGGMVVAVASGFQNRGYTVAFKTSGHGVLSNSDRLWTCNKFSADCPTPVISGGKLFFIRDDGMASCLDLSTGEPHWQERLFSENVKVSPVAGDGKIYFTSGQGNCVVVAAQPKLQILATNQLQEATLSTPSIGSGRLFLRTEDRLYCVR